MMPRPRYTLRTLLVLVTLASALFGWEQYVSWKEQRVAGAIERMQGAVTFESVAPAWLQRFAGDRYISRASTVIIHSMTIEDAVPYLKQLPHLRDVHVVVQGWPDATRIKEIKRKLQSVCIPTIQSARINATGLTLLGYIDRRFSRFNVAAGTTSTELRPELPSIAWPDSLRKELSLSAFGHIGQAPVLVKVGPEQYMYLFGRNIQMDIVNQSRDEVEIAIVDRGSVVESKSWNPECDYDQISLVIKDLNGDGRSDVGVHYWRLSYHHVFQDEFMPKEPLHSERLPEDPRFWLAAYEITPSGFKSLVDD